MKIRKCTTFVTVIFFLAVAGFQACGGGSTSDLGDPAAEEAGDEASADESEAEDSDDTNSDAETGEVESAELTAFRTALDGYFYAYDDSASFNSANEDAYDDSGSAAEHEYFYFMILDSSASNGFIWCKRDTYEFTSYNQSDGYIYTSESVDYYCVMGELSYTVDGEDVAVVMHKIAYASGNYDDDGGISYSSIDSSCETRIPLESSIGSVEEICLHGSESDLTYSRISGEATISKYINIFGYQIAVLNDPSLAINN